MRRIPQRLLDDERAEGVAEYALLIALVALCLIGIIQAMRSAVGTSLGTASADVANRSTASYGSGSGVRVSGPTYGGGLGGGGGSGSSGTPAGGAGDGDDPKSADSTRVDTLVSTVRR